MLFRWCVLAVLATLCAAPAAQAAEPGGATVVLQLPPSMSPEAVRGLIADLVAKSAQPREVPADPPAAGPRPAPTSANLAAQIWEAVGRAVRAIPNLTQVPEAWLGRAENDGATQGDALGFWVIALAGLVAAPLIGRGMRRLFSQRQTALSEPGSASRLRAAIVRFFLSLTALAVFGVLFWTALLGVSSGRAIMEETADQLVWRALDWRLSIIVLIIVLSPGRPDLRLIALDDADARACFRWLAVYLTISPLDVFLVWLIEHLGFGHETVFGAALGFGFVVTVYKVVTFWAIRRPIGRAILASAAGEPSQLRRALAAGWHWFFIVAAFGVFVAGTLELSLGEGAWIARASAATQKIVGVLAVLWQVIQKLIATLFAQQQEDLGLTRRRERFRRALHHLSDALLLIVGAGWLAEVWGLDLVDPASGSVARLFVRPAFEAALTIIAIWIVWTALSAAIDEKMPQPAAPGEDDEGNAVSASRLGTMLPLVRNMALIGLAGIAVIAALSTLGVDIGPLLAGLGVVGLAIGFGAQTLVRDIISGLFFLMEDAFRVGEYIDTGRLRGTVEGMSLRSVRLRHQNGQVHTIPFGQVLSVTNFSRDWSVIKFNLHLDPAADIETVRKTVKRVGLELLDDPEVGAEFIQPLKMQGVIDVLQTSLIVRCKFTATPVRPTYLQRLALRRLIEAFGPAEIRFAPPNVTVQFASAPAA
jgi:moderate conductance mechanosensitive channel